ncbi:8-oxo-dGTP diphosphatase MutT [Lysobacter sp. N42]|uniref:8-oxo-dGTP diphosphatase MutT n=1 Tax=Lysobacter sp. N42 TaxID=2545719 RepID=UPI000DD02742|nr:8-oxo-dGTP diphosphatase MutT [Lysobacter sp. N42]RTE86310.1 8-oxo-dGTP diphosphatase MutT [Aliidiomarina sp. B3213]TCZ91660.1 8-oxo-dGTP diphosphatase MutT [Lysobacter sp. N42]
MKRVHVAVAVIVNNEQEVLLSFRAANQHQGNLWEFPGGKVEVGETVQQALTRELLEELAVEVRSAEPLIEISHDYGDKTVLLDVWWSEDFSGEPHANEGQPWKWVPLHTLSDYEFPAANAPILEAINRRVGFVG